MHKEERIIGSSNKDKEGNMLSISNKVINTGTNIPPLINTVAHLIVCTISTQTVKGISYLELNSSTIIRKVSPLNMFFSRLRLIEVDFSHYNIAKVVLLNKLCVCIQDVLVYNCEID